MSNNRVTIHDQPRDCESLFDLPIGAIFVCLNRVSETVYIRSIWHGNDDEIRCYAFKNNDKKATSYMLDRNTSVVRQDLVNITVQRRPTEC